MSEEKIIIEQFTARIKKTDKDFIVSHLKTFPTAHQGMSDLLSKLNTNSVADESENNNEFLKINETLDLKIAELEKQLTEFQNQPKPDGFLIQFSPELSDKLTALRRVLKQKGKVAEDVTELEFLREFTEFALLNYINDKYSFVNR